MNILYISTSFPKPEESSAIYTDLAEELIKEDHQVTVVVSEEKKKSSKTVLLNERNMQVLRVSTGNLYDVNIIEKGITILLMQYQFKNAIKKHLNDKQFDLILFESPPVTTASVVEWAMKYFGCPSYLMLKDIFPQNALDIEILTTKHPAYYYFKNKEKKLYDTASIIGTMSEGNKNYVLEHNSGIDKSKVKIFPNAKKISDTKQAGSNEFRKQYNIPDSAVLAVYGGNMGKPQGMDFVCEILKYNKANNDVFFLLVGRGTEREYVAKVIKENNINNALLLNSLPRADYEKMLNDADIGLVFLDKRFTIPNYPSRVLSYFEKRLPVLAAIDSNTDFGEMLIEAKAGEFALAGDISDFNNKLYRLIENPELRKKMGNNGFNYMSEKFNVVKSVKLIEEHVGALKQDMEV